MRQSILMNRFGYGLGPTPSRIPKDTEGWLTSQMETKATRVHTALPEMSSAEVVALLREAQQESKMARKEVKKALSKQAALDAKASLYRAISSTTPFAERWVHFWLNHFTVSTVRKEVRGFTGAFEREVIRPYCFGHFSDLLLQVTRHPAMLLYLDNVRSVGPSSVAGRKNRGLNENLAREILELHTLGPDGGYDQSDVEQFARVLTGWSVSRESTPQRMSLCSAHGRTNPERKQCLAADMVKVYRKVFAVYVIYRVHHRPRSLWPPRLRGTLSPIFRRKRWYTRLHTRLKKQMVICERSRRR